MFILTVYFPSSLIVITSFISFWIDPLSVPGRVTLTITSLLALMTQFISVRDPLSDVNHVTAIDVWFMGSILMVALTMFEFALNHFLAFQASKNAIKVRKFSLDMENVLKRPSTISAWTDRTAIKLSETNFDELSRIVFPATFCFYSFLYWIILLNFSSD